jgi:hypothetical protein
MSTSEYYGAILNQGCARKSLFSSATKWLAQAILSDAIKMGVGTACYEKSRNSCRNKVNIISVISNFPATNILWKDLGELALV